MSIRWSYKIKLEDESLNFVEKKIGRKIPTDLKEFIYENNAASPDKCCIMVNGNEKVFESVLSFNENEKEAATFESAYRAIGNPLVIPFGADPFGNYFCYSLKTKKIAFYDHEKNEVKGTQYYLNTFIDSLY